MSKSPDDHGQAQNRFFAECPFLDKLPANFHRYAEWNYVPTQEECRNCLKRFIDLVLVSTRFDPVNHATNLSSEAGFISHIIHASNMAPENVTDEDVEPLINFIRESLDTSDPVTAIRGDGHWLTILIGKRLRPAEVDAILEKLTDGR